MILDLIESEKVEVRRYEGSHRQDGHYQRKDAEVFRNVACNCQPLTGMELLQVPEGDRSRQHIWMYSRMKLKINDYVVRRGTVFEVHTVEDWTGFCIDHYKSRLVKLDKQNEAI